MVPKDKKFAMNCLDYFGVTAMAGVEDLKILRDGAGNRDPKHEWIRVFSGSFTHARFK